MAYGIVNADVIGTSVAGSNLGAGNASIMKNRIINGAMVIDQRNTGASVTASNTNGFYYILDRWNYYVSQASKFTVQQNAGGITPPVGFSNYIGCTSSSAYSINSTDLFSINQFIEGFNTADLGWGTANAKTVTLSFWVYSSLTGTFGGSLMNNAFNRSYPFTYTVSSANTWTQISITIAGDTTGTWVGATNGVGIRIQFSLGMGSTYSGTAGFWSGNQYWSATGATSVVGTNGATFYITGVQLEVGSSATGFEYRQYGQELALCQRYFQTALVSASECVIGGIRTGGQVQFGLPLKVNMRATPSSTLNTVTAQDLTNGSNYTLTSLAIQNGQAVSGFVNFAGQWSSGGTAGAASNVYGNTSNGGGILLSAEL